VKGAPVVEKEPEVKEEMMEALPFVEITKPLKYDI
jgi:hypothetical protein